MTILEDNFNLLQVATNNEHQHDIALIFTTINPSYKLVYVDSNDEYVKENTEFLYNSINDIQLNDVELINKLITSCKHYRIRYNLLQVLNQLGELKRISDLYQDGITDQSIKKFYNALSDKKIESKLIDKRINIMDSYYKGKLTDKDLYIKMNYKVVLPKFNNKLLEEFCIWMIENKQISKLHLSRHYNKISEYIFSRIATEEERNSLIKIYHGMKSQTEL